MNRRAFLQTIAIGLPAVIVLPKTLCRLPKRLPGKEFLVFENDGAKTAQITLSIPAELPCVFQLSPGGYMYLLSPFPRWRNADNRPLVKFSSPHVKWVAFDCSGGGEQKLEFRP